MFTTHALPTLVTALSHVRVVAVATSSFGPGHTLAVAADGVVYAFGAGDNGALGIGSEGHVTEPTPIQTLLDARVFVQAVSVGSGHSIALGADGDLFGWGYGADEGLGLELEGDQLVPKRYPDFPLP